MTPESETSISCESTGCILCGSHTHRPFASGYDYQYWTSRQKFFFMQCTDCHHVYLNPRPRLEDAGMIYPPDYYTLTDRHTEKKSYLIAQMKKKVVRRRLAFLKDRLKESINILEIGCGDGSLLVDLKTNFPEASVMGIDLAISEQTRQRCRAHGILLLQGSVEKTQLPSAHYDLVIMNQVIEHLWSPVEALANIHQALRPGGVLSIETVNISGCERKWFPQGMWGGYYFPRHLNLFSFESLRRLLEQSQFSVVKQYSLLGVVCWAFSFRAFFCRTPESGQNTLAWVFSDKNPMCLALFTVVDLFRIFLGLTTSNQKVFAVRD